jgi:hypothetical protein
MTERKDQRARRARWSSRRLESTRADRSDFTTENAENPEIIDTSGWRRPTDGNRRLLWMAVTGMCFLGVLGGKSQLSKRGAKHDSDGVGGDAA